MQNIKTQVGIIGAGPAGLTLALLLHRKGIKSIVIESKSREYVESRVRAGLLEHNTVEVFQELGVADRLMKEGLVHHGCYISYNGKVQHIDFQKHTQKHVTIYGQQEVVKDLISACIERGIPILFEASAQEINDIETEKPSIIFTSENISKTINCDYVAGCDGFHGISRKTLPKESYNEYQIEYPFSWLGILANAKPNYEELIYAYHTNGFALASMRSEKVCRLYLQVPNDEKIENWSDNKIWEELEKRLGINLDKGEIFEKGITPMRSFMIDNMQMGRLFLAGDSAHIVPPTGAKGLNLAVADVYNLANALVDFYFKNGKEGDLYFKNQPKQTIVNGKKNDHNSKQNNVDQLFENSQANTLNNYTKKCLERVWRVQDFSNFMTYLCHKQAEEGSFDQMLQKSKFDYLCISEAYQKTIAENYVGLPFEVFK